MDETRLEPTLKMKVKNIRTKREVFTSRVRRKLLKHVWVIRGLILLAFLGVFVVIFAAVGLVLASMGLGKYMSLARDFVLVPSGKVESVSGRTNILILGKGGVGHEAPDLTDTMIFVSVSTNTKDMTLISLPRDIWIENLRAKLNSAYFWGNKKTQGGGIILAKATVEQILGQPIQYAVVIDFSGLKKIIDFLGGIEVNVENSFTDEKFPIAGREANTCDGDPLYKCRYETITFEKGTRLMDGEIALKFVRSRNAQGDEGTDLARARRQQKLIDAIEKKVLTRKVLFSPSKIKGLIGLFNETVETDIPQGALGVLVRHIFDSRNARTSYVLGEDFLTVPLVSKKYDNLYVFIPKAGDWSKVGRWVREVLFK